MTRRGKSASQVEAMGAQSVVGDCRDVRTMGVILSDADALVHIAGILLGAALANAGISPDQRCVVVSTAGIYSRTRISAELYRQNEDAIRARHPTALFVRPTMIYGSIRDRNVHHVMSFARRWRVLPLPALADARIQPIHYDDLASALASLTEMDTVGTIDAGGPSAITLRGAGETIFRALGQPARFISVPLGIASQAARVVDRVVGSRWTERLDRMREDRTVDTRRLLELTRIRLRSFEEGVAQEVAEMERGG